MHAYLEPASRLRCLHTAKDKIRQRTIEAYKLETILMKKIIALAVAAVVAAPAMADLTIGADARYQLDNTGASANRVNVVIAGSTTAESGMFVSAKSVLNLTGTAAAAQDGDNNIVVGNAAANIAFGATESAGVYSKGTDAFRVRAAEEKGLLQERVQARASSNIVLNVTAVEGLTAQLSGNVEDDSFRTVLGYDMGVAAVKVGIDRAGNDTTAVDAYQLMASTTVADIALAASYANMDFAAEDVTYVNLGASAMGFSLNWERAEGDGESNDGIYGAYTISNTAGL